MACPCQSRENAPREIKSYIDDPLKIVVMLWAAKRTPAGAAHPKGKKYAAAIKRGALQEMSLVDAPMKAFQGPVSFIEWIGREVLKIEDTGPPPLES
jgi:hypothetical protein